MQTAIAVLISCVVSLPAAAARQPAGTLRVEVRSGDHPVKDAEVVVRGVSHRTDALGVVTIAAEPGRIELTV